MVSAGAMSATVILGTPVPRMQRIRLMKLVLWTPARSLLIAIAVAAFTGHSGGSDARAASQRPGTRRRSDRVPVASICGDRAGERRGLPSFSGSLQGPRRPAFSIDVTSANEDAAYRPWEMQYSGGSTDGARDLASA
jgi:hypothetical protein